LLLVQACRDGNVEQIAVLLQATPKPDIHYVDPETGATLLHDACGSGSLDAVQALIRIGVPWNSVDFAHKSAGEAALEAGHMDVYDALVQEGIRSELLLEAVSRHHDDEDDDEPPKKKTKVSNAEYLASPLVFSEGRLLDSERNAVMMGWEHPLMIHHAKVIAPKPGLDVLNVGFGLGLVDKELQKLKPRTHTIIEAHPDVYKHMLEEGWDKIPGVKILFGRWQDVVPQLETYDGIFFDTFGEYYADLKEFHEVLPNILRQDGIYSYFNGLGGTDRFFHDVYCQIADLDLQDMCIQTEYVQLDLEALGDEVWQGTKRPYWSLNTYNLPICKF
ncbi:S-adenosyl-L-methionine-dependent methyltransferase, partial [Polychytrium aggregatum]|uniref:S-adenosyl-L-methionine-dependent methyltransferase n=1 Tax=Polychytrium aggregatum TaxID=110093 RepID=UPI0022FEA069